jgi:hypothetical protein
MTKREFLKDVTSWNNHLFLLWEALMVTKGKVVEFGSGFGSTNQLRRFCQDSGREFETYDNNEEWASKTGSKFIGVDNWDSVNCHDATVILIDHSPGERRVHDVIKYKDINGVLVLHDTDPPPTLAGYGWEAAYPLFKYRINIASPMNGEWNGVWATALSNTIDVTEWKDKKFGIYKVSD